MEPGSGCPSPGSGSGVLGVDGGGDAEPGPVAFSAAVAQLAAAGDGLDPPEGFLDPFPDPHRHGVAGVSGRASVNGGALPAVVLGDVRGEPELAGLGDEPAGVIALVTGDRAAPRGGRKPGEHLKGGGPLGIAVGGGQL